MRWHLQYAFCREIREQILIYIYMQAIDSNGVYIVETVRGHPISLYFDIFLYSFVVYRWCIAHDVSGKIVLWCQTIWKMQIVIPENKTWPTPIIQLKVNSYTLQYSNRVIEYSIVVLKSNMDASQFVTSIGVIGLILLMCFLVFRFFGPRTAAWIQSNREEKMSFSKNRIYNANGYLVSVIQYVFIPFLSACASVSLSDLQMH